MFEMVLLRTASTYLPTWSSLEIEPQMLKFPNYLRANFQPTKANQRRSHTIRTVNPDNTLYKTVLRPLLPPGTTYVVGGSTLTS